MNNRLYVGNLSFDTTENDLQDMFSEFGTVSDVNLITDRMSGRSRGFAFVTMGTPEAAQAAIQGMSGRDVGGRSITVNEARPKEEGGGGGGGGGGYRGGGGGGGGGYRGGGGGGGRGGGGGGGGRGRGEYSR